MAPPRLALEDNPQSPSTRRASSLEAKTKDNSTTTLTRAAAIVRIGSRHCSIAAMSRSLPTHASMGRWARWYPRGVRMGVLLEMKMAYIHREIEREKEREQE